MNYDKILVLPSANIGKELTCVCVCSNNKKIMRTNVMNRVYILIIQYNIIYILIRCIQTARAAANSVEYIKCYYTYYVFDPDDINYLFSVSAETVCFNLKEKYTSALQ